jgi:hypothetical protein
MLAIASVQRLYATLFCMLTELNELYLYWLARSIRSKLNFYWKSGKVISYWSNAWSNVATIDTCRCIGMNYEDLWRLVLELNRDHALFSALSQSSRKL